MKYSNARLRLYSGRFATNPKYLFFAQFIIEQKKVSDSINIALKKAVCYLSLPSQLKANPLWLVNLFCQDEAYSVYFRGKYQEHHYSGKTFMYEVIAVVRQLGLWHYLVLMNWAVSDIRIQGNDQTYHKQVSCNERCQMLNLNTIVVAKHFQYRVETLFSQVLLTNAKPTATFDCCSYCGRSRTMQD